MTGSMGFAMVFMGLALVAPSAVAAYVARRIKPARTAYIAAILSALALSIVLMGFTALFSSYV